MLMMWRGARALALLRVLPATPRTSVETSAVVRSRRLSLPNSMKGLVMRSVSVLNTLPEPEGRLPTHT